MTDVFQEVRARVSAENAARYYGITFDRRGWALCPFHQDKHPSVSFKNGRFRCFACEVSGDSIDLVGKLFDLDTMGAVRRLNQDFALTLPIDRPPTLGEQKAAIRRKEVADAHAAFEDWRENFIASLNAAFRVAHLLEVTDLDKLTVREAVALKWQPAFEHWGNALTFGPPEEQAEIYRERGRIAIWIGQVLNDC